MTRIFWRALLAAVIYALGLSCAAIDLPWQRPPAAVSSSADRRVGHPSGSGGQHAAALQSFLTAELSRLGKSGKAPAAAPSGADNAVFDLSAAVSETAGLPTGVELTWTERLLGDYDQNGQVSAADLAPLGMQWQAGVAYDAPELHGGIAFWPSGDPADGSAGAANWRMARNDGNADGVLDAKDVTPLAQHWQERCSGWRVYRKGPGESNFTPLPGADSGAQFTVARPASAPANAPVRYTFTDQPPTAGQYEYHVVAFAALQGEAEAQSNHASVDLSAGFADSTPPQWQGATGIASATPNADGTVTLAWGTALDNAVPPAPASPPVSYNVYYSTQTPLDFGTAARAARLTGSPWVSPVLPAGVPCYFAVRAQDSATPLPNEDTNVIQLAATPGGGSVEDHDPPVWTMQDLEGRTVSGIFSIAANNGELVITCADASDALTPPVHYDLYYISGREVSSSLWDFKPLSLPAGYQVVTDIPKAYHFPWENRHKVYMAVSARDSANPPNVAFCARWIPTAPADVERIPMDPTIPGYDPATQNIRSTAFAYEPEQHLIYKVYAFSLKGEKPYDVWFVTINGDTGKMQGEYVMSGTHNASMVPLKLARSWTGELWFEARSERPRSMFRRTLSGAWTSWDVDTPAEWQKQFDHNGLPAFFMSQTSDVQSGRLKLLYNWYDEANAQWQTELVCDPGAGTGYTHRRPDGVLQVISGQDAAMPDDVTPKYTRILERHQDSTWTSELADIGSLGATEYGLNQMEIWGSQWAWTALGMINDAKTIVVYGANGFGFLPNPDVNNVAIAGDIAWPANGGYWHLLPYYLRIDGELRMYETYLPNYLAAPSFEIPDNQIGFFAEGPAVYDVNDGYFARTAWDYDLATGRMQASLIKPVDGKTIFDP